MKKSRPKRTARLVLGNGGNTAIDKLEAKSARNPDEHQEWPCDWGIDEVED